MHNKTQQKEKKSNIVGLINDYEEEGMIGLWI